MGGDMSKKKRQSNKNKNMGPGDASRWQCNLGVAHNCWEGERNALLY